MKGEGGRNGRKPRGKQMLTYQVRREAHQKSKHLFRPLSREGSKEKVGAKYERISACFQGDE